MKVDLSVTYPKVTRQWPDPSEAETVFPIELNIGCPCWQENTAMRHGFCELLFAGCGNHPGLDDGIEGAPFDSGDRGINNVHRQWAPVKTRSMCIGDLINIDPNGLDEFWLCDSAGFVLLTQEQAVSWLDFPRQYGCQGFEVREWKKANGLDI